MEAFGKQKNQIRWREEVESRKVTSEPEECASVHMHSLTYAHSTQHTAHSTHTNHSTRPRSMSHAQYICSLLTLQPEAAAGENWRAQAVRNISTQSHRGPAFQFACFYITSILLFYILHPLLSTQTLAFFIWESHRQVSSGHLRTTPAANLPDHGGAYDWGVYRRLLKVETKQSMNNCIYLSDLRFPPATPVMRSFFNSKLTFR